MLPDAILAAWRAWLVWCQISQTHSVLLMESPSGNTPVCAARTKNGFFCGAFRLFRDWFCTFENPVGDP
jgi:hypothetical protein